MFLRASHFEDTYVLHFHSAFMSKISQCGSTTDKSCSSGHVNRPPGSCYSFYSLSGTNQPTRIRYGERLVSRLGRWPCSSSQMQDTNPPISIWPLTPWPLSWSSGAARSDSSSKVYGHLQGPMKSSLQGVDGQRQQENSSPTQAEARVHLYKCIRRAIINAFGKTALLKSKPCPQTLHFKSHYGSYPDFREV